jgi:predicted transposase/invertase (TIGR01784 family)
MQMPYVTSVERRAEERTKLKAIPKLLQLGLTIEQIAQALELSLEQVQEAAQENQQQQSSR